MKRSLIRLALTAAAVAPLAACGGGDDRDDVVVTPAPPAATPAPPPVSTSSLESLGATFAGLFRASADTEPRDAGEGDLPPISFTTEPVDITGA